MERANGDHDSTGSPALTTANEEGAVELNPPREGTPPVLLPHADRRESTLER